MSCDDYCCNQGCNQGRGCPARMERMRKIRDKHEDPIWTACIQNITIILIALLAGGIAFLYAKAL